jgi:hypothetical protein
MLKKLLDLPNVTAATNSLLAAERIEVHLVAFEPTSC